MKRSVGRLQLVLLLAVVLMPPFLSQKAHAENCSNVSNYGAVTVLLPQFAKPGEYAIWVRMQSSDSKHNKVLVEINQADCLTFGGELLTAKKQWQWVPYSKDGVSAATYTFTETSNNYAKIIGIESDVKVDKIMVTPVGCVPTGAGDGCVTPTNAQNQPTIGNTVKTVQPLSNVPVSGKVYPTATIEAEANTISAVSYSSDGTFIQRVDGAGMFDTTLIPNGKHSISMAIARKNGNVDNEITVIEVKNPESVLSPLIRWYKLNTKIILLVIAGIAILAFIRFMWWSIRSSYEKRRYRKFHGL